MCTDAETGRGLGPPPPPRTGLCGSGATPLTPLARLCAGAGDVPAHPEVSSTSDARFPSSVSRRWRGVQLGQRREQRRRVASTLSSVDLDWSAPAA
eukprot:736236-Prorocentrum_minimum.AAC.2